GSTQSPARAKPHLPWGFARPCDRSPAMRVPSGFQLLPAALDAAAQKALAEQVLGLVEGVPAAHYVTPGGKAMSVAMSNLGPLGWVSDAGGYRYQAAHPGTGSPWPPIPRILLDLWAC